jgi:hypothetical protein
MTRNDSMTRDRNDSMMREEAIAKLCAIKRQLDAHVTVVRVIIKHDGTEGGRIQRKSFRRDSLRRGSFLRPYDKEK